MINWAFRISLVFGVLLSGPAVLAQDYNIYFDFNSDVMRINDLSKLYKVVDSIKSSNQKVLLVGHTDTVGNATYNLELSKRRTNALKKQLLALGLPADRIVSEYKGKQFAVHGDQYYNRRVEIFISKEELELKTFKEFRRSIQPNEQQFVISANAPIQIEGNRGTIISFPENAFVTKNGKPVTGNIVVQLTEYYTMSDFFSARLSTIAEGNLLTSAGMIHLSVKQGNKALQLKEKVDIELMFPKTNENRYATFYGSRLPDSTMTWLPDEREYAQRTINDEDFAAVLSPDGKSLIVMERRKAGSLEKIISFDSVGKAFGQYKGSDSASIRKHYEKQNKIYEQKEKYYNVLRANKLEFINCDDYIRDPSSVPVEYFLRIENEGVRLTAAGLIFRKSNSYLDFGAMDETNAAVFGNLPIKADVELIVLGVKDDQPYYYVGKVKLAPKKNDIIRLEPGSYERIKKLL